MTKLSKNVKVSKPAGAFRNKRNKLFVAQMSTDALKEALRNARGTQKSKIHTELTKRFA